MHSAGVIFSGQPFSVQSSGAGCRKFFYASLLSLPSIRLVLGEVGHLGLVANSSPSHCCWRYSRILSPVFREKRFLQIFMWGKQTGEEPPTVPPIPQKKRKKPSGIYLRYLIRPHTLTLRKAEPHTHTHIRWGRKRGVGAPGLIAAVLITAEPGRAICDPVF